MYHMHCVYATFAMMTSSNGNIFRVTGHLCGEFTGPRRRQWPPLSYDDVMKWKHFPRYWPFVRGIHRSPVNSLHKGQWRGAFMFSLIGAWINLRVNNREADDLRRYRAHYDVIVMPEIKRFLFAWCVALLDCACHSIEWFFLIHWHLGNYTNGLMQSQQSSGKILKKNRIVSFTGEQFPRTYINL